MSAEGWGLLCYYKDCKYSQPIFLVIQELTGAKLNGKQSARSEFNLFIMGRFNILATQTVNYLELIGNGKIYKVPPYQRNYSWTEEQWEDLWNDLFELSGSSQDHHYMGALVMEAKSDREYLIIDGQQRLATLSILGLVIIEKLKNMANEGKEPDKNRERANELRKRFIGEKDPASLVENSRLSLNKSDDPFYQDYLVQGKKPLKKRGLSKSNRLLWECFEYFSSRFNDIDKYKNDGELVARFLSETTARQLLFIQITVDNELNAYTVFETLNARGLELTVTDLLKNYLFSKIRIPSDQETIQRRWQSLISVVGQEHLPDLLRFHLLCSRSEVRKQRLFKLMREEVKTPEDVFALMEILEKRAELFAAIFDPNHEYWSEKLNAKPFIKELNLFRMTQMIPLLFSVWEKFDSENFVKILKMVSVISFRYSIVSGLNPTQFEKIYPAAAKAVIEGKAAAPKDVFDYLKPLYVDDKKFEQDFALLTINTDGQQKKLAKYILSALEQDFSGRSCDPDTDPGTIEHILPQNPSEEWSEEFPKRYWEEAIYRLGNFTLLEVSANRLVGSAVYSEKLQKYKESKYALTQKIAELAPESWTLELLNERQAALAKRAVHLWRLDF